MISDDRERDDGRHTGRPIESAGSMETPFEDTSIQKLLAELRVHQIELEMQNDELVRSEQALTKAHNRYEALFENAPVGYFVLNREGIIQAANNNGTALLGAAAKNVYHKPFIVFLPQKYHAAFFAHLHAVFSDPEHHTAEMQLRTRSDKQVWCRFESVQHQDEDGVIRSLTAVVDISDRRRIEDDLIVAKEEAVAASRAKSAFLANMSHEIRTPMHGVLAMSEIALESAVDAEQRQFISAIHVSARSLLAIINDILDLSRIEADKIEIRSDPFAIREALFDCVALFRSMLEGKSLEMTVEIDESLPEIVISDQTRFRQIMVNLLGNAVKFTPEGSISVHVTGRPLSDHVLELSSEIRDTGIGISDDMKYSIFESFTQAEDHYTKRYQGTGLGLTISRQLARLMGGQVYFESVLGAGSSFFFTLPVIIADSDEVSAGEPVPDAPVRAESSAGPAPATEGTILVAEDNAINALVVRTILAKAGYTVYLASTGVEALDQLARVSVDMVLMDVSMPDMDGLTATRHIRAGDVPGLDPAIPVVAMTAHVMSGDRKAFQDAEMTDVISKPFARDTVLSTVSRILSSEVQR